MLGQFHRKEREAIRAYRRFMEEGKDLGRRPELVGGGLVRSLGGWAQVVSFRRKGIRASSDDRILGSSEFVDHLLLEADEREKETLRLSAKVQDLTFLARRIAKGEGLTELELRSGSRQRKISLARRLFCKMTVGQLGYPGAHVARFLGVTTSAVVRAARSKDLPGVEKYL